MGNVGYVVTVYTVNLMQKRPMAANRLNKTVIWGQSQSKRRK